MKHIIENRVGKARDMGVKKQDLDWKTLREPDRRGGLELSAQTADKDLYQEANHALRFVDSLMVRIPYTFEDPTAGGILEDHSKKKGSHTIYKYEKQLPVRTGAKVFIQFLRASGKGNGDYVKLTFSVQKLVLGNNFQLIRPGTNIIAKINAELADIANLLGMPAVDISQWEVRRIDLCYNFQVGENVPRYLSYAQGRIYPRRDRREYNNHRSRPAGVDPENNGINFWSASVQTVLYRKGEEYKHPLADGLLRLESRFMNAKAVQKRFFCSKSPLVSDLTPDLVHKVLWKDMVTLGLVKPIQSKKTIFEVLAKAIGPKPALRLLGFVSFELQHPGLTAKDAAPMQGCTPKTVNEKRRKLRETGVSFWEDEEIVLPPLMLDIYDECQSLADDPAGILEATTGMGEKGAEVPRYTSPAPSPIFLSPAPIELAAAGEVDALASALFGKPTIKVALPARQDGEDEQAEDYTVANYGNDEDRNPWRKQ